ncbi:MAG: nitronate monooxygenase [Bacillota bacterium]|nr:nitronate monooxygenase [Bacillota bacterium]
MKTRLTELLGIRRPVVQGGLAYLARAELAAAVGEAGGLGQVTAATLRTPGALREEVARLRRMTRAPFGINFALGHWDFEPMLEAALELEPDVISITGGNPEPVLRRVQSWPGRRPRTFVLVSSVRQAKKAEALGADVVVAVGAEGGGHIGRDDTGTLVLVREVVDAVQVPVVASGGIVDGRGLAAALALGADGIEMGTRFVATRESPAHPAYKQALVEAGEAATALIEVSLGRPGRALKSPWVERIREAEAAGAPAEEILPLVSGERNVRAALEGVLEEGFAWAGQGSALIHDIPGVAELLDRIEAEAREAAGRLRLLLD